MQKIVFWMGNNRLAELPWPHGLESAKTYAFEQIMVYSATHSEVIDTATGAVIVTYLGRRTRRPKQGSSSTR